MATNSLPRWLISITDMPASCQLTSSHFAFSSTSTGMVPGPAPKLKMRAAGLVWSAAAVAAVAAVAGFAIFVVAIHDSLQARKLLARVEVDERHALGGTAHLADFLHARADEHAARGDEHDLVVGRHQRRRDHLAVALRGLDRDHALRAAPVPGVLGDGGALAEAVLGRGEHALRLVLGHQQRDHLAALREVHAAHAARAPPHGKHVVLVQAPPL